MVTKWKVRYKPKEKIKIKCKICGETFLGVSNRVFCSKKCAYESQLKKENLGYIPKIPIEIEKPCQFCNSMFKTNRSYTLYCSKECRKKVQEERNLLILSNGTYDSFYKLRFEILKRKIVFYKFFPFFTWFFNLSEKMQKVYTFFLSFLRSGV
jgi:hypothetical protein